MAGASAVPQRREPTPEEFVAMQRSPEFQDLRGTFRGFTFPMMIAALVWYVFYVLLATFAPEFMARPFLGLNWGLWLGLLQFVTTFLITWVYVRWANKNIEPRAAAIRQEMEG
ncbi:DUF485 domain-containing protein [Corynebacterium sp. Marseille-P4321]|uniref:DUF485 domain-containing protein n=1 Tax=Corynebacterium sp. Marseille-P4321 TaxID=2736603 RepID=UPI00089310ED|nr:DUF485 domain-containing protein [Corynebacterium sp. Marseille-P4321]OEY19105.1 hypothetical protein A0K93_04465 [Corynebacterium sp. BCW_4722]